MVDQLRNSEKVDLVIVLAHAGTDPEHPENGESYKIAQNVSGIDVLLSGHTHLTLVPMLVTNLKTGKQVILEEPGAYGNHVGKLSLVVDATGKVTLDQAGSAEIAIDDRIAADPAMLPLVNEAILSLEATEESAGRSMLERTLSAIEGSPVKHDPKLTGDLYFRTLGKTGFATQKAVQKETGIMRLDADAMLTATDSTAGKTDLALIAAGMVRDGIWQGKNGTISFADVFRINPLGQSPLDGTAGFPILRLGVLGIELKAVLEITASFSYRSLDWADRFLVTSGICFEYDTARSPFDMSNPLDPNNGRVTKIAVASNHSDLDKCDQVIFELPEGWKVSELQLYTAATDYYLALFAESFGLILRGPDGKPLKATADAILRRTDGSEYKTYEALASYIRSLSPVGGTLPARYNDSDPAGRDAKRAICKGPLCR